MAEKEKHKERCLEGMKKLHVDGEESNNESEDDDDREWYRQEVGEEPDPGINTM